MIQKQTAFYISEPRLQTPKVSIIIPCRNEAGNIEAAVERCPSMGILTELVFVEGNSMDTTRDEIKRVADHYTYKNIRWFIQDGKGKADAVRKGFAHATGDILMILDADLTMPPEDLPQFFDALISGKGDFINGTRLIYGMESGAMDFPSWMANIFFAKIVSFIIKQKVTDSLCGTKVLWKKDYERIVANKEKLGLYDPFGDFDLLFGAAYLQLKIVEVPIHYKRRTYGKSNINKIRDVWFLLWMCWRMWWVMRNYKK